MKEQSYLMLKIKDFLRKSLIYHNMFAIYHGVDKPLYAYHSQELSKQGDLDFTGKIQYCFHGLGCRVENIENGEVVDFEFGPNDRIDGFDAWKLWKYIESQNDTIFTSYDAVKEVFNLLVKNGEIVGPSYHNYGYNLWFLKSHIEL